MAMNCKPVPTLDERINDIRMRTAEIVNNDILPNERRLWAERREDESFTERTAVLELRAEIKEKVKKAGLWAPHLPTEYGGMGLDFLELAYMYEILSYAVGASALFGIAAPNSGNAGSRRASPAAIPKTAAVWDGSATWWNRPTRCCTNFAACAHASRNADSFTMRSSNSGVQ